MVILKLTPPVSSEFECEVSDASALKDQPRANLVRPCERYLELYRSCKSIRGRLHQYYVYGEKLDCQQHKSNYDTCLKFRETNDLNLLKSIIDWEENMINTRLRTVEQNKAWEPREIPPQNFDGPLPDFIARRTKSKHFEKVDEKYRKP